MESIDKNIKNIIKNIEFARKQVSDYQIIKLVAVSKYYTSSEIKIAFNTGQRAFAESRVQDLKQKQKELIDLPIQWHFIGNLQTNKINALIDADIYLLHSLSSMKLACELNNRLSVKNNKLNVLLQVNHTNELNKTGFKLSEISKTVEIINRDLKYLNIKGLMAIGPNSNNRDTIIENFRDISNVFKQIKNDTISILSMGMSSDYELGIACGSNMIRVGSLIFDKGQENE
jgi:pyridoxal phosphate enzyme (YggS family)